MKKLLLLFILSFITSQSLAVETTQVYWDGVNVPDGFNENEWRDFGEHGLWCVGDCGAVPSSGGGITVGAVSSSSGGGGGSPAVKGPTILQAFCTEDSDITPPILKRENTEEYWSTYFGDIVNHKSLKEFFSITNNQYNPSCDSWFRKYVNSRFHKALVFAYDTNLTGDISYWGITLNIWSRRNAKQIALNACEASSEKIESHACVVLFSNNDIVNKDYLALAKMSEDEYRKTISNYEDENYRALQATQSESTDSVDYIEKIKEAKSLLDAGIISEEEFEEIKKKIIDNI